MFRVYYDCAPGCRLECGSHGGASQRAMPTHHQGPFVLATAMASLITGMSFLLPVLLSLIPSNLQKDRAVKGGPGPMRHAWLINTTTLVNKAADHEPPFR